VRKIHSVLEGGRRPGSDGRGCLGVNNEQVVYVKVFTLGTVLGTLEAPWSFRRRRL